MSKERDTTCYVTFESNPTKEYAYLCGNLSPKAGQLVVVTVGLDHKKKKLLPCVRTGGPDPKAFTPIFGIVQEQIL
jgi:hypothetical protein